MTILGVANSRMKDFFDIATIARRTDLEGAPGRAGTRRALDTRQGAGACVPSS